MTSGISILTFAAAGVASFAAAGTPKACKISFLACDFAFAAVGLAGFGAFASADFGVSGHGVDPPHLVAAAGLAVDFLTVAFELAGLVGATATFFVLTSSFSAYFAASAASDDCSTSFISFASAFCASDKSERGSTRLSIS